MDTIIYFGRHSVEVAEGERGYWIIDTKEQMQAQGAWLSDGQEEPEQDLTWKNEKARAGKVATLQSGLNLSFANVEYDHVTLTVELVQRGLVVGHDMFPPVLSAWTVDGSNEEPDFTRWREGSSSAGSTAWFGATWFHVKANGLTIQMLTQQHSDLNLQTVNFLLTVCIVHVSHTVKTATSDVVDVSSSLSRLFTVEVDMQDDEWLQLEYTPSYSEIGC